MNTDTEAPADSSVGEARKPGKGKDGWGALNRPPRPVPVAR
jgi:hypothetical protein